MKLIAIETASETCSAALFNDGEIILRYQMKPRGHSELILTMMDEVMAEGSLSLSDLDAVAYGRGPGSFTGVRIAAGVIQGVAFAADLPVVPVSTLAALAQRAYREKGEPRLLTAFDARMGELYWAGYQLGSNELVTSVIAEQVASAEQVEIPIDDEWYGVGSGWAVYAEQLEHRLNGALLGYKSDLYCSARDIALLAADRFLHGEAVAPEHALPVYLRNQVAEKM
ncbi:MAG: tRNA (adenosine(37)-N6)-threonylcarbamoyltransferase complex dimerization subunit type 1 TsaB [Candidatus Thiodiazotropha sp.]